MLAGLNTYVFYLFKNLSRSASSNDLIFNFNLSISNCLSAFGQLKSQQRPLSTPPRKSRNAHTLSRWIYQSVVREYVGFQTPIQSVNLLGKTSQHFRVKSPPFQYKMNINLLITDYRLPPRVSVNGRYPYGYQWFYLCVPGGRSNQLISNQLF